HTLTTFTRQNDGAAYLNDARRRAHAFDPLIEIQVQRITAVCRHHDLKWRLYLLHRGTADKLAAGLVRQQQVSCKHAGDLLRLVETDIEQEARTDSQRDVAHFLPERVSFGDAKHGARIADIFFAVIAQHRFESGATGHDAFRTAAEPGEKVWLDETGDDPRVGFGQMPVEERGGAVSRRAELNEFLGIFRLMAQHAVMGHDGRGEHFFQFATRIWTMGAE